MNKELHNKSKEELSALLEKKREDLMQFRFTISGSKVKNVKMAHNIKKDIARIMTALRQNKTK